MKNVKNKYFNAENWSKWGKIIKILGLGGRVIKLIFVREGLICLKLAYVIVGQPLCFSFSKYIVFSLWQGGFQSELYRITELF